MTDAASALTSASTKQAEEAAARFTAKEAELEAKGTELEARTKELEDLNMVHEV